MKFNYRTEVFLAQIENCYFAPSRRDLFPNATMYQMARNAMLLLWNADEIELLEIRYDNEAIRKTVMTEMLPQRLDHAVKRFMQMPQMKSERQLAELIFHSTIFDGIDDALLVERNFSKGGAA